MSASQFPNLMSPGEIGGIKVRNKIVMPAMGLNMAERGFVNQAIINHYEERAKGGAGLIIVEVTCVDTPLGLNSSRMLVIDDDKYIPGFRKLTDAIHAHGAKCILEISHTGRGARRKITGSQPVGPSAVKKPFDFITALEGEEPRALTVEEIKAIEDKYAEAALRAKKAGFDGVEVHGAGYYLVAQFFSSTANRRTDEYGGDAFKRARFALNITRKIKERAGEDFPIFFKLNVTELGDYGGVSLLDGLLNAYLLQQAGVRGIEVLAGAWSTKPGKKDKPDSGQGCGLIFPITRIMKAARITKNGRRPGFIGKKAITIPLIGGVRTFTPELAEKALARGWADFIFMGRGLLTQPDLPNMIANGTYRAARPCIGCGKCIDGQLQRDERIVCSGNPVVGIEDNDYTIPPAEKKKKVLIVGGGPAGVEAARIATIRGHDVTLFEKKSKLGGQLHQAVVPPHKENLKLFIRHLEELVKLYGIKVVHNKTVTAGEIIEQNPDAVICATGVLPARLPLPGFDKPIVMNAKEALSGARTGKKIVIIGGGQVGCETAQFLAERGKKVAIVELLDNLAAKMVATSRTILLAHLKRLGVKAYLSCKCKEIKNRGVVIEDKDGNLTQLQADNVLIAVGDGPDRRLYQELKGRVEELYAIGDCAEPASVLEATSTGYRTGLRV